MWIGLRLTVLGIFPYMSFTSEVPQSTLRRSVLLIATALATLAGSLGLSTAAEAQAPAAPSVCAVTNADAGAFVFWEAVNGANEYVYATRYNNGPERYARSSESSLFLPADLGRVTAMRVAAVSGGATSNGIACSVDGQGGQPPATQPPQTQPPATQPPATQPPATQPPATQPPVDETPVEDVPETPADSEAPADEAPETPAEPEAPADEAPVETPTVDDTAHADNGNRCNAEQRGNSGKNANNGNRCNTEQRGNSGNSGNAATGENNGNRCNAEQRGNSGKNANNGNRCNAEQRGNSAAAGMAASGRNCHAMTAADGVAIAWKPMADAAEYVYAIRVNGVTRYDRAQGSTSMIKGLPEGARVNVKVGAVYADGSYGAAVECGEATSPAAERGNGAENQSPCAAKALPGAILVEFDGLADAEQYAYTLSVNGGEIHYDIVEYTALKLDIGSGATGTVEVAPILADGSQGVSVSCGSKTAE